MISMFSWMRQISIRNNRQTTQSGKGSGFICARNDGITVLVRLL